MTAYLHHKVTVDAGTVMRADEDKRLPCVRFVFHPGYDEEEGRTALATQHQEVFLNRAALPDLIADLTALSDSLE